MGLQDLENFPAVFDVGFVSGRAQRRTGGIGDQFQVGGGFLGQVEEILVDDAGNSVQRAVNMLDAGKFTGFANGADQRLVNHRRRAATLGDQNLAFQHE